MSVLERDSHLPNIEWRSAEAEMTTLYARDIELLGDPHLLTGSPDTTRNSREKCKVSVSRWVASYLALKCLASTVQFISYSSRLSIQDWISLGPSFVILSHLL